MEGSVCLAKAYLNKQDNEPILQDIAYIRLHDDRVELETLFGHGEVVPGRIIEIDFAASKILIEQYLQPAASDEGV
jgi:predicted RNA-binding protein